MLTVVWSSCPWKSVSAEDRYQRARLAAPQQFEPDHALRVLRLGTPSR